MFWYACTFMKPTYPIDCMHMGIFSLRSGASFNANACLKCPRTSYFCPFRMYILQMRVFCNAPVISKPAISLFFPTLMHNMQRMRYIETHAYIRLPATSFFFVALLCCFQHYRCVEIHVSVFLLRSSVFLHTLMFFCTRIGYY
jgi:hypothetical protein